MCIALGRCVWGGPTCAVNVLSGGARGNLPAGGWKGEGQRGCPPGAGRWGQRPALGKAGKHAGRLATAGPDLQGCPFLGPTWGRGAHLGAQVPL